MRSLDWFCGCVMLLCVRLGKYVLCGLVGILFLLCLGLLSFCFRCNGLV